MSNHSNTSDHGGHTRRKSKTWNDGNFEQSIHLRDIFGSGYSFEDDPSPRNSLESASGEAGARAPPKRTSSASSASSKKPSSPQHKVGTNPRKLDRIRRPISKGSQEGAQGAAAAPPPALTSAPSTKSIEKSIHLRDIFGSQYSFADDPSKHERQPPKRTSSSSAASTAASDNPSSPQHKLRQRKQPTERIRRPIRSTNSSGSQEGAAATTAADLATSPVSPDGRRGRTLTPIKRTKSNRTIHRTESIDSIEGIPKASTAGASHFRSTEDGAENAMLATTQDNVTTNDDILNLLKAEEGSNHNNINHESAASFFQDEPSLSRSSHHSTQGPMQQPIVVKATYAQESSKRTWCCGCGIFLGLMSTFALTQLFSLLIWKPEPIIIAAEESQPQLPQVQTLPQEEEAQGQPPHKPHSTPVQVGLPEVGEEPLPPLDPSHADLELETPPEADLDVAEEAILGHLPPETLQAINHDNESPQSMALRWFHADPQWQTYSMERRKQRFALATLYFATNPLYQHTWKDAGTWLSYDVSECEWSMSSSEADAKEKDPRNLCQSEQGDEFVVTNLPLQDNNLHGQLPMVELSLLTSLTDVDLRRNAGLTGQLPERWCAVPTLLFDCAIQSALTSSGVCGCGQCVC